MPADTLEFLVPFYGPVELLKSAVLSIARQEDPNWTATIFDDAYPAPGLAHWVKSLNDPRISYERNRRNLGANGNYRRALERASGDYVVFMGADDLLLPTYVGTVRSHFASFPSIIQPGVEVIDAHGASSHPLGDIVKALLRPTRQGMTSGERAVARLMMGNWTYFPSLAWRRETIKMIGFRPYHVVQDLALIVDVLQSGGTLLIDNRVSFAYRRHSASDSAVKSLNAERFIEERLYLRSIALECRDRSWPKAARWAQLRPTSRINALTTAILVLLRGRGRLAGQLLRLAVLP